MSAKLYPLEIREYVRGRWHLAPDEKRLVRGHAQAPGERAIPPLGEVSKRPVESDVDDDVDGRGRARIHDGEGIGGRQLSNRSVT